MVSIKVNVWYQYRPSVEYFARGVGVGGRWRTAWKAQHVGYWSSPGYKPVAGFMWTR